MIIWRVWCWSWVVFWCVVGVFMPITFVFALISVGVALIPFGGKRAWH